MILGLTGKARCGKDTVARYLSDNYHFAHLDFYADVIVPELEARKMRNTKLNASKLGNEMREEDGMDVMAKRLMKKIDAPNTIVTGFRSPQEVEYFRRHSKDFTLVMIDADEKKRFSRKSELDPKTEKGFFKRDEMDAKAKKMEEVFLMADEVLDNNGTLGELQEHIEGLLEGILEE